MHDVHWGGAGHIHRAGGPVEFRSPLPSVDLRHQRHVEPDAEIVCERTQSAQIVKVGADPEGNPIIGRSELPGWRNWRPDPSYDSQLGTETRPRHRADSFHQDLIGGQSGSRSSGYRGTKQSRTE